MGSIYIDTGGSADNSGSTDQNAANLSGAAATVAGAVVTLDGSPDLSGLITSGATQSSININGATNSNQTIFWITAFDNSGKTVTVTPSPTGVVSNAWKIGGRHLLTSARVEAALRAGDVAIFNNSPAAANAVFWTFRNAGDSTSGFAKIKGKSGVTVTLNSTGTTNVIATNSLALCWVENLTMDQDGASGDVCTITGVGNVVYNCKIVDGGGRGIIVQSTGARIIGCSITGVGSECINVFNSTSQAVIYGNYIRSGAGTNGITVSGSSAHSIVVNNIIAAQVGRGILFSGGPASPAFIHLIYGNTIYGCGNSGLEITDANTPITLMNNIFKDNGNAAGESNVEWVAGFGEAVSFHGWNIFNNTSGADAPINFTLNAQVPGTELTTDPLFTNAAAGDFSLGSTSPAINAGFPGTFPGSASVGFLALGAAQPAGAGATFDFTAGGIRVND